MVSCEEQEPQRLVVSRMVILRAGMPSVSCGGCTAFSRSCNARRRRKSLTRRGTWLPSPATAMIGFRRPGLVVACVTPRAFDQCTMRCGNAAQRHRQRPGSKGTDLRPLGDARRDPAAMVLGEDLPGRVNRRACAAPA